MALADLTRDDGVLISDVADPVSAPLGATVAVETAQAAHPGSERRRFALNAMAGGLSNAVKIGIQLVMLPLMAHLLGPAEFGLYALALPTIAFFMALADGGLGAALAREKTGSSLIWSSAFWLLIGIGLVLALGVTGGGFLIARLAEEPKVRELMAVLSISFLLVTASVLPTARLTREGRLVVFNAADLAGNVAGAGVAIALALAGAGAMSLAVQYVTVFTVRAVILNSAAFVRPTFEFQLSSLKDHVSTGSALMGSRLCDFCGRLVENLVYGRIFGPSSLGTYTFANQAPRFLCEAASGPVWGALYAQALHEDRTRVAALHANVVRLLALAVFPMAFLFSATAPELLGFVLGPKWGEASVLLRIIIPFYAFTAVASQSGAVMLAEGAGWLLFWLTLALSLGRVGAVGLGAFADPVTVAWSIGLVQLVLGVPMLLAPAWRHRSPTGPLIRGVLVPVVAAAAGGAACYALIHLPGLLPAVARLPEPARLVLGLVAGVGIDLLVLAIIEGRRLRGDLAAVMCMLRRRTGGETAHAD